MGELVGKIKTPHCDLELDYKVLIDKSHNVELLFLLIERVCMKNQII